MICPHCNEEFPLHVKHRRTSAAAGEDVDYKMNGWRLKVLDYLRSHPGGATDEEITRGLAMNPSTQRPRRVELCAMGEVVDTGRLRRVQSGQKATVWDIAPSPSQGALFAIQEEA
jgi:hypothetical protein